MTTTITSAAPSQLVTNSTKYGSLSASGSVLVRWFINDNHNLEFHWTERDGPPVREPTRKGFGSTIIEHSVPYDLGGVAKLDYKPEGFVACFTIPRRHLAEPRDFKGKPIQVRDETLDDAPVRGDVLAGLRVLMIEDSLIIALDAEDILRRLGARDVMTEGSVTEAIHIIEIARPDIAILDINLGDHNSFAIADRLDAEGIPFMFATGYGERIQLPDQHRARIVLQKPYTMASLARRLPELVAMVERREQGVAD